MDKVFCSCPYLFTDWRSFQSCKRCGYSNCKFYPRRDTYSVTNRVINKSKSLKNRKRPYDENAGGGRNASGLAFMVGPLMDNIPKNIALNLSIITGGVANIVLIVAFFLYFEFSGGTGINARNAKS